VTFGSTKDAIAAIHTFGSRNYHWVLEADIAACFDEPLKHSAVMDRVWSGVSSKIQSASPWTSTGTATAA